MALEASRRSNRLKTATVSMTRDRYISCIHPAVPVGKRGRFLAIEARTLSSCWFAPYRRLGASTCRRLRPDCGRTSQSYRSGGHNSYPREVGLALEVHPDIAVATVVGLPDASNQSWVSGVAGRVLRVGETRPHQDPWQSEGPHRTRIRGQQDPVRFR